MSFRRHCEASELAANRTAYSLARELLGTRSALVEARADRDGLAATLDEVGRLSPTDFQGRDDLLSVLLGILRDVRPGARTRSEASALRRYAMRLHEKHDWRDHLLVEADRIENQTKEMSHG